MNVRTTLRVVTLTLIGALLAAWPARSAGVLAEEPYEINVILSLNGPIAFLGHEQSQSLALLEKIINRSGGIRGRPIRFNLLDDTSNPQVAVQLTNALMVKNVPVILGPDNTATCNAVAPIIRDHGPVDYCFSPGIHPTLGSYMFAAAVPPIKSYGVMVNYMRARNITRLAMLASTDGSGQDGERSIGEVLSEPANKGITLVAVEHFNPTDISVNAQIERIKEAKPQALFVSAAGTPFGTVLHALTDTDPELTVFSPASNLNTPQMVQYASLAVERIFIPGPVWLGADVGAPAGVRRAQRDFFEAHRAIGVRADFANGLAWDPSMIVVNALRTVGTDATSTQLRDAIEHTRGFSGIEGTYDFANGTNPWGLDERSVIVTHWDPLHRQWLAVSKPGGS
jgi:branched-chain amino acid transport system substrate-binding protein